MFKIKGIALASVLSLLAILLFGCARKEATTPAPSVTDSAAVPAVAGTEGVAMPVPDLTGIPDVGSIAEATPAAQGYAVRSGDTLYAIAVRFDTTVDALAEANNITDPNALQVGQQLNIPSTYSETGPGNQLLPNSEFVNSPAYVDFDVTAFCLDQGGYLCSYQETVDGQVLTGPEIIDLVAHHYSIGPRLLLAILEMKSGWVTNPNPAGPALSYPMGYLGGGWESLHRQLIWAADRLNQGYYDWRGRGMRVKTWDDGTAIRFSPTLNAATAGLQFFLSLNATEDQWQTWIGEGPDSFIETYRGLFGDPAQYAIEPLIPADTVNPSLELPWSGGEVWLYAGGPHGGWGDGSAWSAVDFDVNEGYLGCQMASSWARAVAPGLVIYSQDGEVMIDLDEDGHEETGWVIFYLHVGSDGRVPAGSRVRQGDRIGHPSCEGGFTQATHLHIARRYNGEWIAADGPLPLILSGWQFYSSGESYEGSASRPGEERTACECRDEAINGLTVD